MGRVLGLGFGFGFRVGLEWARVWRVVGLGRVDGLGRVVGAVLLAIIIGPSCTETRHTHPILHTSLAHTTHVGNCTKRFD